MKLVSTLILTLLVITLALPASAYTVEANHPRLFVNENTVAGLRAVCNSAESTRYNTLKTWVDDNVVPDSYPLGTIAEMGSNLEYLSHIYLVEQNTSYLHEAVLCANSMFADFAATWDTQEQAYPRFYDWCYGGMGATRRALFGDSLAVQCARALAGANWGTNNFHSMMELEVKDFAELGIALAGDGYDDAGATAMLDSLHKYTFGDEYVIACMDSVARDGGGYQGDYTERVVGTYLTTDLWLWEVGTNIAAWDSSSCVAGLGDYMLYDTGARSAVTGGYAFGEGKQNDSEMHAGSRDARRINTERLANAYNDSTLIWLVDQYEAHASAVNRANTAEFLFVVDTLATAITPAAAGYLSAKQFDIGTVFMREGWDLAVTSTDVWATYRHEQFPYGHSAADAGHFIMGRGNDLMLIDSGEYTGTTSVHHANYFRQTLAHNAITIKDFSESFDGAVQNTGGQQLVSFTNATPLPTTVSDYHDSLSTIYGDRGKIGTFEHVAGTRTYIKSDLTKAYSSAKVDTVRREFVWLENKDAFLIFDYADVDSTGFLQKSLYHTIAAPADTKDVWTVTEGGSSMRLHFFWNASSDTIGGTGDEFDANGTNYPPAGGHDDNGAWRIEALTPRDNVQRWMLTVIEVVASGAAFASVDSLESDCGNYYGAAVDGDTLLFHKYGGAYATGGIACGGGGAGNGDAATGRRPIALDAAGRNRGRRGRR